MTDRRREWWVGGALAAAFVCARVLPFVGAHTGLGTDSFDYLADARLTPFSRAFIAGPRPLGYPLYLKMVRHDLQSAVVGQLVVDTLAWLALACVAARAVRRPPLRLAAFAAVLAIGATFESIQWDRLISSEALSTAAGVGLLAALLWLRERWTVARLVTVAALALAATAVRDSNGSFLGVVAVVLIVGIVVRRLPVRVLALALVFFAVAALGSIDASQGRRWEGPLKDVITIRVLESPERTAYFERAGMPLSKHEIAAIRGYCVTPVPAPPCHLLSNPRFFAWVHDHGRSTYLGSLVKFPATTAWEPLAHLRQSVGTRLPVENKLATDSAERAPVSKFLEAVFFVRNPLLLALWSAATLLLAAVAYARGRRGFFVVGAALVALTYPHLLLVWLGGALEVTRHSLLASVELRVGLWLTAIGLLDACSRSVGDRPQSATISA